MIHNLPHAALGERVVMGNGPSSPVHDQSQTGELSERRSDVAEGKKDVTTRNFAERLTQGHRPEVIRSVLTAGGYDDRFPQSAFAGCRRPYRRTLRAFRRR
jgi:hypothetical protein